MKTIDTNPVSRARGIEPQISRIKLRGCAPGVSVILTKLRSSYNIPANAPMTS